MDNRLGLNCPGCGVELTVDNAGGYRCFCTTCVDAFPDFPKDGKGYVIEGRYPNFSWVEPGEGMIATRLARTHNVDF